MSTRTNKVGMFSRRMLTWASVVAVAMSFALTAIVMANNLHQFEDNQNPDGISWDDQNFQGTGDDCKDAGLEPGEVLWHFVHTGTDSGDLPSELTAEFDSAGTQKADGEVNGNSIVMYNIITGEDTLLSASDDIQNDGNLNLSHICFGGEEESASAEQSVEGSASEAESASAEQSVEASASGEQSVEAGTGTPSESTPDGSFFGAGSNALATIAFSLILLASLGGLAYANVKTVRNRI